MSVREQHYQQGYDDKGFYSRYIYNDIMKLRASNAISESSLTSKYDLYKYNKGQLSNETIRRIEGIELRKSKVDKAVQLSGAKNSESNIIDKEKVEAWNNFTVRGNIPYEIPVEETNNRCIQIINDLESPNESRECPFNKYSSNPPNNHIENNEHIKNLKKLLYRSLNIIKALCGQIALQKGKNDNQSYFQIFQKMPVATESEVGNLLDELQNAIATENERLLSKKVDLLTSEYKGNRSSMQSNGSSKLPLQCKIQDPFLTSMDNSTGHKGINEAINMKGGLQMTFQPNTIRGANDKEDSVSRSIKEWKTFIAGMEDNNSESEDELNFKHNKSYISKMNSKENINSNDNAHLKTNHKEKKTNLSNSYSRHKEDNSDDILNDNLSHIEDAMSSFLGGFKDIKSELSQIGVAMQSCSEDKF